mmetsp:Transcript_3021/g.4613  ORF Transcript_3021/g.4613 Transcript_3021/m.4613 type:complete len:266 (-) Transcript_3021:212-1009(-)
MSGTSTSPTSLASGASVSSNMTSRSTPKLACPSTVPMMAASRCLEMTATGHSGADAIRCRLLYKLGISLNGNTKEAKVVPWKAARVSPDCLESESKILLGDAVPFCMPLKQDAPPKEAESADSAAESADSKADNKAENKKKRSICFSNKVSVLPIPLHSDYSRRLRTRLWSGRHEIKQNAARNTIEFAAEGWDWRTVTEDEKMYVCALSGQLVHPVHCRTRIMTSKHTSNRIHSNKYPLTSAHAASTIHHHCRTHARPTASMLHH